MCQQPSRSAFIRASSASLTMGAFGLPAAAPAAETVSFAFHNSFWMNLHHRLYREAMAIRFVQGGEKLTGSQPAIYADIARVPRDEAGTWKTALDLYLHEYVAHDLLFDDRLSAIKTALARSPDDGHTLIADMLPAKLAGALRRAAPIYRTTLWREDTVSNMSWIANAGRLVARFGHRLARRLGGLYRTPWPRGPYRVDVVRYSHFFDAYTTDYPYVHAVISSGARGNAGRASLETLYHEASHSIVFPDYGTVGEPIEAEAKAQRREEPDQLWHAVIFYTTGIAVQEAFRASGEPPYQMFGDASGLFKTTWRTYREPLALYWQRYIDGRADMNSALRRTVRAIIASDEQTGNG